MKLHKLVVGVLALSVPTVLTAVSQSAAAAGDSSRSSAGPRHCVIIDTDFDIDDMMAIPTVIGNRTVAAVITSEGYTKARPGASALSRLLAEPGQRNIPVIVGANSHRSRASIVADYGQYVLTYRAMMDRLNNFLPTALPLSKPTKPGFTKRIVAAVAGCRTVEVEVIGTFTSFVKYSPAIRSKISRVVIMGKPLRGDKAQVPGRISFNCAYDLKACKRAFNRQLPGLKYAYVDVPRTECDETPNAANCVGKVYGPTLGMVQGLGDKGLPNTLKQVLLSHPESWALDDWESSTYGGRSLLWDQSASLFMLDRSIFKKVGGRGGHFVTTVSPEVYRAKWTSFTNTSKRYQSNKAVKQ